MHFNAMSKESSFWHAVIALEGTVKSHVVQVMEIEMEKLDYWRLCDELTVVQAALLITGEDPGVAPDWVINWDADYSAPSDESVRE